MGPISTISRLHQSSHRKHSKTEDILRLDHTSSSPRPTSTDSHCLADGRAARSPEALHDLEPDTWLRPFSERVAGSAAEKGKGVLRQTFTTMIAISTRTIFPSPSFLRFDSFAPLWLTVRGEDAC